MAARSAWHAIDGWNFVFGLVVGFGLGAVFGLVQQPTTPIAAGSCTRPRPDQPAAQLSQRRIKRKPVLGGLINEYKRAG
jgi:hypothetical protein